MDRNDDVCDNRANRDNYQRQPSKFRTIRIKFENFFCSNFLYQK
jgi:hypothetical protein